MVVEEEGDIALLRCQCLRQALGGLIATDEGGRSGPDVVFRPGGALLFAASRKGSGKDSVLLGGRVLLRRWRRLNISLLWRVATRDADAVFLFLDYFEITLDILASAQKIGKALRTTLLGRRKLDDDCADFGGVLN